MNVLLINTNRETSPWPVLPLGLSYIASSLEAHGHRVRFLDLCFVPSPRAAMRETLSGFRADAIGVSVRNIDNVSMLRPVFYLEAVRDDVIASCREGSTAPLLIGGSAVGVSSEALMDFFGVDFALAGEGERSMPLWLKAVEAAHPDFSGIPGLYRRSADGTVLPPERLSLDPLGAFPHPRPYAWVDYRNYRRRNALAGIQTKRGCAYECLYCSYGLVEGCAHRLREPEDVAEEMAEWMAVSRPRGFEFVDSVFNAPEAHAVAVCEAVLRKGFRTRLTTMDLNPGPVSRVLADAMRAAGFRDLMCSPDSASPAMLERLRKNFTAEDLASAAALLKRAGIRVFWFFTFGGPGESAETVRETLAFCARHLDADDVVFFSIGFRVFPRTALERVAREEGMLAAECDLLRPAFYCSPRTSPLSILKMIHAAAGTHPNFVTLFDFDVGRGIQSIFKRCVPFYTPRNNWRRVPSLNRLLNRWGILPRVHRRQRETLASAGTGGGAQD